MNDDSSMVPATPADRLLPLLAERLGGAASAKAVFGQPVERDGVTIVPVAKVRYGFGGGCGSGPNRKGAGEGGGGGAVSSPVGFIEIRGDEARFRPITSGRKLALAIAAGALVGLLFSRGLARTRGAGCRPGRGPATVLRSAHLRLEETEDGPGRIDKHRDPADVRDVHPVDDGGRTKLGRPGD